MPGEVIAITGNTGRSTGPHLHLTCKYKNHCVDPDILLQFIRETKNEAVTQFGCFGVNFFILYFWGKQLLSEAIILSIS